MKVGKEREKINQKWKDNYESGKGKGKNKSNIERRINTKLGKEKERTNQRWKGEKIWKWQRKGEEWIKCGSINMKVGKKREKLFKDVKDNKYESWKSTGKIESKLERRMNVKAGKEWERINQSWKGGCMWNWERKHTEWIAVEKEDEYESVKGLGKNELKVERRTNMKMGK